MVCFGMLRTYSSMLSHCPSPQAAAEAMTDIFCRVVSSPSPQLSQAISYSLVLGGEGREGESEGRE